jgi:hypothetical protein
VIVFIRIILTLVLINLVNNVILGVFIVNVTKEIVLLVKDKIEIYQIFANVMVIFKNLISKETVLIARFQIVSNVKANLFV